MTCAVTGAGEVETEASLEPTEHDPAVPLRVDAIANVMCGVAVRDDEATALLVGIWGDVIRTGGTATPLCPFGGTDGLRSSYYAVPLGEGFSNGNSRKRNSKLLLMLLHLETRRPQLPPSSLPPLNSGNDSGGIGGGDRGRGSGEICRGIVAVAR